jgi:hypothetical protein
MTFATDDFNGAYREIDVLIEYSDGRPSKTFRGLAICRKSGLISSRTLAKPEHGIEAGWNCAINQSECDRLGITMWQVMRDRAPESCLMRLGNNPGGVTVSECKPESIKKPRKSVVKRTSCLNCGITNMILLGRGYCTDCHGEC